MIAPQVRNERRHFVSRAAIRIAFYSGMRLSEILEAERKDAMNVSKEFKAAAVAVGMDHLRFHDLRHSAASQMINAKVDLYTVGAVLGHKSAASTKRYSHLATDSIKAALNQIGKKSHTQKKTRAA